jgi:predicted NodU family carbamoyl transferase
MYPENRSEKPQSEEIFNREAFRREIREKIKSAIANPEDENILMLDHVAGRHNPPESAIQLTNLSAEKIDEFYGLVIEELKNIKEQKEIRLSESLESLVNESSEESDQNTIDHEKAHAKEAVVQSIPLGNCVLELFFTESGFGL